MFTYFYHERIRKSVAMFGKIFNNLYVINRDQNGKVISQVKVPLSYGPKRKFLERLRENPDLDQDTKVAIKLPRMAFEITSINYDAQRQLPKTNNFTQRASSNDKKARIYTGVPYTLTFELSILAKTQNDALQIVEQILPYFNPQYTLTVRPIDEHPEIREDIPLTLQSVNFTDNYEGALEARREIIYTLTFEMPVNFYGPASDGSIIRQVDVNLYTIGCGTDSDGLVSKINVVPDPIDVSPDSDYGFTTTITSYVDGDSG